jgi:hypothetical protein
MARRRSCRYHAAAGQFGKNAASAWSRKLVRNREKILIRQTLTAAL